MTFNRKFTQSWKRGGRIAAVFGGRRSWSLGISLASLLLVVGCGRIGFDPLASGSQLDGGVDADPSSQGDASGNSGDSGTSITDPASLAGIWSLQSATYATESGPQLVPRATAGTGILGEFKLSSSGPLSFDYMTSYIELDNYESVFFDGDDGTIQIQADGLWLVMSDSGDVTVVRPSLSGDDLTLIWEREDPRNDNSVQPALEAVVSWNPGFSAKSTGDWQSLAIGYRSGNVYTPTSCIRPEGETLYQTITMFSAIDALLRVTTTVVWRTYSDSSCTMNMVPMVEVWTGLAVESGSRYQFWMKDEGSSQTAYLDAQFAMEGGNLRIDTDSCLPTPSCLDLSEDHLFEPAVGG